MRSVAIIGAGPSGLVTARWLKREGFEPVIFDQGDRLGGQWTADSRYSGVWPSMRTNTSRLMTAFSDLAHEPKTFVYPANQGIRAYLQRYAEHFDLVSRLRLKTRIQEIDRDPERNTWLVRFIADDGVSHEEAYSNVVVATGRYNKPAIAPVAGLASFSGCGGIVHTFGYKQPESYRGLRVLVAGCSISALEIASDLAMLGAARVISTNRRQRYVLHKLLAGVPLDHLAFTRFSALAEEHFPREVVAGALKAFITQSSGSPEQFGAPKPADYVFDAGITQSQHFLPLVAEGRIEPKPWMTEVNGQSVRFADGSVEEVDAMIFGTGYDLHMPFLSATIRQTLNIDRLHADLYKFTFHPDLPGLSFVGMFDQIGPYFPTLELQARWIAYTWSGAVPQPSREQMHVGITAYRARRGFPQATPMHTAAIHFAREAGVEPEFERWPELARILFFGPLSPISFRLSGRDSLPDAPQRTLEDAFLFGAVPDSQLTLEQCSRLQALAAARNNAAFSLLVEQLTTASQYSAQGLSHTA
jgi:dimethylaniline monooxygenase (N-oxide forming)